MQCFFLKLVQMSNFGLIISKSEANPQNPSDWYGGYYLQAPFRQKYLLSNTVLFL